MRIRLEPDGLDRYKVVLPGENSEYPIGLVWKDPMKKSGWCIKAYFMTMYKDDYIINDRYDDCMKAARKLAHLFDRINNAQNLEITDTFSYDWQDMAASD